MTEVELTIAIEDFMKQVIKPRYERSNFATDYQTYVEQAKSLDEDRDYSPLVQAYLNLLPDNCSSGDKDIFLFRNDFECFQDTSRFLHEAFLESFKLNNTRNAKQLTKYFNYLVEKHCKLLLVRVDLSYQSEQHPDIQQFDLNIKTLVNRIQNRDRIFKDQVGYVYRLEQGGKCKGYHCHLLVIYNGSKRYQDSYLGQKIGEMWKKKITGGTGQFYNCNQTEHKQKYKALNQLGIGMINRNQPNEIKNALLAISYLACPEKDKQYLRMKPVGMREFSKGQMTKSKPKL